MLKIYTHTHIKCCYLFCRVNNVATGCSQVSHGRESTVSKRYISREQQYTAHIHTQQHKHTYTRRLRVVFPSLRVHATLSLSAIYCEQHARVLFIPDSYMRLSFIHSPVWSADPSTSAPAIVIETECMSDRCVSEPSTYTCVHRSSSDASLPRRRRSVSEQHANFVRVGVGVRARWRKSSLPTLACTIYAKY